MPTLGPGVEIGEHTVVPLLLDDGTGSTITAEPRESRRPEPELVAVPMEPDQELVFGWMGLNPALLLEEPPAGDNVVVRVVRPGSDPEAVLEEARQQLAASGQRRRRGRGGRGNSAGAPAGSAPSAPAESGLEMPVEITPLPEITEPETVVTVTVPTRSAEPAPEPVAEVPAPEPEEPVEDDGAPRRRRRRSSAAV